MKKIFIALSILICANSLSAQTDSTKYKEINLTKTKSEIIGRYRGLIMDNLTDNNKEKVRELFYESLAKYENDYYMVFYPSEKWIIGLWLGDYNFIISETTKLDSASRAKMQKKVKPFDDQLFSILWNYLETNKGEITTTIEESKSIEQVDKEFLKLIISTITTPEDKRYQNTINAQATVFINDFPNSRYDSYVRNFIRFEYTQKGFQFGIEYFGGATFNSGKLAKQFTNSGNFGLGFIFGYDKFNLNTRGTLIFNRIKQDIDYNGIAWEKGRALSAIFEISLSHNFNLFEKTVVQPIIGIAWYETSPIESDKNNNHDLKNVDIYSKAGPIFGVDLCFKYSIFNYFNYFTNRQSGGYYTFNIRYQYQPVRFERKYEYMNGQTHNIVIGFKMGMGKVKRVL